MNVEQELPLLFEKLADEHIVGPPPALNGRVSEPTTVRTGRSRRFPLLAAAACCVVLIAGLIAIGTRTTDPAPSTDPVAQPVSTDGSSTETTTSSGIPIDQPGVSDPAAVVADVVVSDTEAISLDKVTVDLAEAGISPADDARNRAIAKTLVNSVVGLGADVGWEPTDVVVRLKDNLPFYMTADSPEDRDQASVTIEIRQYRADELADPDFLEEIGLSQPVERYEDGSSLFIRDDPKHGFASANVVTADLVITVRSQDLVSQDRAPVKAHVLTDAARDMAAIAQRDLLAN